MNAPHEQGRPTPRVKSARCRRLCQPQAQTTLQHRAHLTRGVVTTAVYDGGGGGGGGGGWGTRRGRAKVAGRRVHSRWVGFWRGGVAGPGTQPKPAAWRSAKIYPPLSDVHEWGAAVPDRWRTGAVPAGAPRAQRVAAPIWTK